MAESVDGEEVKKVFFFLEAKKVFIFVLIFLLGVTEMRGQTFAMSTCPLTVVYSMSASGV